MRNTRKILALILVMILTCSSASGCIKKQPGTTEPVTEQSSESATENTTKKTEEQTTSVEASKEISTSISQESTTAAPTEEVTEPVTEQSSESVTENTTQKAEEQTTSAPTIVSTEAPTTTSTTVAPTEKVTQPSTTTPTQAPTQEPTTQAPTTAERTREEIMYEEYDEKGRRQVTDRDEIIKLFMEGFNELRAENGLPPVTEDMMIPGMMAGSQAWANQMAAEGTYYHGNYSWIDAYRDSTNGYSGANEGVSVQLSNFQPELIKYEGRSLCEHIGAHSIHSDIKYLGLGFTIGWYYEDGPGDNPLFDINEKAIYFCINTVYR